MRVESWPFISAHLRTPEEEKRWWDECYIHLPQEEVLRSHIEWTIVTGEPGCGKSTLLNALRRSEVSTALILDNILPERRAGDAAVQGPLLRIMRASSQTLRQHFLQHPEHLTNLSNSQREFLRWLIEKFNDSRSYVRWLDGLPSDSASVMDRIPFRDLYETQTQTEDIHAQVEELLNLSRRIGCERILVLVDTDYPLSADLFKQISSLFDSLELMQHIGLRLVAAMPQLLLDKAGLLHKARGRVHVISTEIDADRMDAILQRHLEAATEGAIKSLDKIAAPKLFARIRSLITNESDALSVKDLLGAVNILLECATREKTPLPMSLAADICAVYHKRNSPLRLNTMNEQHGVWRGQRFIELKEGPYELLKTLWRAKGNPIDHFAMQSSKQNIHTLARRLRVALEPDPAHPIYVLNRRNEGYWLENFAGDSVSGP